MLKLTPEQKALFALLGKKEFPFSERAIRWDLVKKEAKAQTVFLLAANSEKLPPEIKAAWYPEMLQHCAVNFKALYAIQETDRIMREANCHYVILKGLASASYYPDFMQRALGDVDFLIDPSQRKIVEKALEDHGYQNWNTEHICHVVFRKPEQNLEMHFEISGIPNGVQGEFVRQYMKKALDQTVSFPLQEQTIPLPIPQYHGLILLLHMQHHMLSEGLGLRHLMDWCCFVEQTKGEPFWKTDLLPLLQKIGLLKYAKAMTKTGALYFGTELPGWCQGIEESLCDAVMQDILIGGNFGRKNRVRSTSGMMISQHGKEGTQHGKIVNLWKALHSAVCTHHPEVQKIPALYLFWDLNYVAKWSGEVLAGKRASLLKSVKYVNERKSVYDQLELFQMKTRRNSNSK